MKKRITSFLLAAIMLLGLLPSAAFAADSVEEALGEVNIYNGGYPMSYLSINGRVQKLIYAYYNYIDRNGITKEIPAYCINPNTKGVPQSVPEGQSIKYLAEEIGSDPKVVGIVANGYPTRSLAELGLENKYQGYYATKMALWCYLLSNWDINNLKVNSSLAGVELQRANKILSAAKDIYRRGTAWTKVYQPRITSEADRPEAYPVTINGQEYLQQIFTVTSETWVCDYDISVSFTNPSSVPEGAKIVDLNNQETSTITTEGTGNGYSGKFKVIYPVSSINGESGSVQLSYRCNVYNYGVYYAVCAEVDKYGQLQNYMVDTDPTVPLALSDYSNYSTTEEDTPETSLKIIKVEAGTDVPLSGAIFEVVDPEGASIGTFATNSMGQIVIPLDLIGTYTVYERVAPNNYLLSSEPAQNIKVVYGEQATVTFENEPYGTLRVNKYSNTGMSLPGAIIQIEHIKSGVTYTSETNAAGVAIFDEIKPGAYRIVETASPVGYLKDDTVYTATVTTGETTSISIVNEEKPGLRILKYDSKTKEVLPGVTFEVYKDTQLLGNFTTDEFGEILLVDLEPGTYLAKEVDTGNEYIINSTPQQIELNGGDGILQLIFFNEQKPGIHLIKLDSTSLIPQPNARFRIELIGGTFSKEYVTDENGEIDLSALEPGAYTVTELEAPDGYLIDDASRVIQLNGNENAQFVFTNTQKPSFRLVKLDSFTGEPLGGATFRIAKIEDGTHYLDRVTDANGEINIADLDPGVYSVQEMTAPEGYVKDSHEYHVELFPGITSELVVSNDRKPNLEIVKTDAISGAPMEGVTFTVKKVDSSTLTTVTSGADGTALIENLDPGVYEIWEQSVPDSYLLNEEHQLITLVPNRTGTVQFQNYPKPTLKILKVDSITGDAIKGAKFSITYASNDTFTGEVNDLGTYYTDENGEIEITKLQDGWYKVTELEAAAGYAIKEPATQECFIRAGTGKTLTFENTPLSAIIVKKVDSVTGDPLQGAWFRVRYLGGISGSGGTIIAERQTSSNGTFVLTGLKAGTYIIEEISAPDGYVISEDDIQTVYLSGEEQDVITVTFGNDAKGSLLIKKIDSVTHEPLSDVQFMVTRSDGTVIGNSNGTFTTDSAGTILIHDLDPNATVVIKEIRAKDGYLLDETPQTIKIKSGETVTAEFRNQPLGGLRIVKLDSVTHEPLAGVQFKITYSDGSYVSADGGKLSSNGLYRTDENGEILISDLVGTIVVTEVETIPGYIIDENTRSQTVVIDPDDLQTLTFYNTPSGGLQIIKSDEDTGERISGVRFEVRKINGEIVGTYTTDRNGVISIPNAQSGWYNITELKAADGYELDATPVQACVKDGETATVEITNKRMCSILIHKVDATTGKGIYGVKFVLYDDGKNPLMEIVTDQDGYAYIQDELEAGKYFLRELEAAEGYILDEQYKTVYVERGKCTQIEWENSAVTGQIQIRKYAEDDNPITGDRAGSPLKGAVYEITQARSGSVVGYIVTDAHGVAASDPLPLGRYYVTEVSAPGYYQLSGEKLEAEIEYPNQIIKLSAYNKSAQLGVTIKKTGNYEVQPGQIMSYSFSGIANTSNVALNNFYWHDRIPTDATRAISITTGTYNQRLYYKVTFKTNLNDYRTLASNLLTSNNYSLSLNATTLGLVQGEYVTDVRFEFGTVASGFATVMNPSMRVQVLGTVSNGYQIINRADVGGQYLNEWQTAKATWVTTVRRFQNDTLPKTGY